MLIKREGISELLAEHEAIRNTLAWLESTIDFMLPLCFKKTYSIEHAKVIKENINNLRSALYHLKEATDNHEKKDMDLLKDIVGEEELRENDLAHQKISDALNKSVMQVDLAAAEDWNVEELKGCMKGLKTSIHSYAQLVLDHIQKEDSFLKLALERSSVK